MKIQNPHDKFFKESFGNLTVAKDFLINYLPGDILERIDLNSLVPQKDSFINEELQEVFSDMLFQVDLNQRQGYLYFLFEHKSYPSKTISLQLLNYMLQIWETKMNKEMDYEIPVIIPLVIYHGKARWQIKTSLSQLIPDYQELPPSIQNYIPDFQYQLYDISQYTDDEIKGDAQLRILLAIFRDILTKSSDQILDAVFRAADTLLKLDDQEKGIQYFDTFMRYVFSAGPQMAPADINKIINQLETNYPGGSEKIMTLADYLREEGKTEGHLQGLQEGLERGIEQGMEKGLELGAKKNAREVARKLLKLNLSIDQIADTTGLTKKEVTKLAKEMSS